MVALCMAPILLPCHFVLHSLDVVVYVMALASGALCFPWELDLGFAEEYDGIPHRAALLSSVIM